MGKLLSMHLAVTGEVAHLYHIKRALAQGGVGLAGPCDTNGSLARAPDGDHMLISHPSGVMRRFGPWGVGRAD